MNKIKKEEIRSILSLELNKIRESAEKTDEATKERLTGWSAAGDKYHAQAASDLTKSYLQKLELLDKELKSSSDTTPERVEPPCLIRIEYSDGNQAEFLLVENGVSLPEISFISVLSPLGKAILGKKAEEIFSYDSVDGNKYKGKIISIE